MFADRRTNWVRRFYYVVENCIVIHGSVIYGLTPVPRNALEGETTSSSRILKTTNRIFSVNIILDNKSRSPKKAGFVFSSEEFLGRPRTRPVAIRASTCRCEYRNYADRWRPQRDPPSTPYIILSSISRALRNYYYQERHLCHGGCRRDRFSIKEFDSIDTSLPRKNLQSTRMMFSC